MHQITIKQGLLVAVALTLTACLNHPVIVQNFETVPNQAVKTKHGVWLAKVPDCNNYVDDKYRPYELKNLFGCARAKNLAYMIAYPKDFVRPARTYSHPGAPLARATANYEMGGGNGSGGNNAGSVGAGGSVTQ